MRTLPLGLRESRLIYANDILSLNARTSRVDFQTLRLVHFWDDTNPYSTYSQRFEEGSTDSAWSYKSLARYIPVLCWAH